MLRQLLPLIVAILTGFTPSSLKAQDTLIMKDGTELYVKVMEVSETTIAYKKQENPDGPTYTTGLADIFMAVYKGGKRETFNSDAVVTKISQNDLPAQKPHNTGYSLSNKNFEIKLVEVKNLPVKKNNAISVAAVVDVFAANRLFGRFTVSAWQRTDATYDFSKPNGSYWVNNSVSISAPDNLSKILWGKFENYQGKGYGWALPPKFFSLDPASCCVGFLQQKNGNKEMLGFGGITSANYNLQDCSSLENKILSVVLIWLETNFIK